MDVSGFSCGVCDPSFCCCLFVSFFLSSQNNLLIIPSSRFLHCVKQKEFKRLAKKNYRENATSHRIKTKNQIPNAADTEANLKDIIHAKDVSSQSHF